MHGAKKETPEHWHHSKVACAQRGAKREESTKNGDGARQKPCPLKEIGEKPTPLNTGTNKTQEKRGNSTYMHCRHQRPQIK